MRSMFFGLSSFLVPLLAVSLLTAADRLPDNALKVELFEAMKAGQVEVKMIPKDARQANVMIENKAGRPLAIKLPDAFAGVPVLAQIGMGGAGMGGMGVGNGLGGVGGGMQGLGGGMGGMGMGGMGMGGMGGGFFNVAPDKIKKIKVTTVCLEHGKKEPTPRVPYKLRPIETFTQNQETIEICRMLGRGEISQNVAQAAAWHLQDGLSWQELAAKDRVHLSNGYREKYFTPQEIMMAGQAVAVATSRAKERQPVEDPGDYDSLSRN